MPGSAVRKRSIRWFAGAFALGLLAAACGDDGGPSPVQPCSGAACGGGGGGAQGPWYDRELDPDTSYLPMGQEPFARFQFSWELGDEQADVDVYYPQAGAAPVALMLPGLAISADRYTWFGSVLASHGVAVAIAARRGDFSSSTHALATLDELATRTADASSPLTGKLDLSRLLLAGHSQGAVVQAGITDVPSCPAGFCKPGATTPDGIRGLLLMGFHMEGAAPTATPIPIPAIEAPWLILLGEVDGLTSTDESTRTFSRLQDRPIDAVTIKGMNHFQFTDYVNPETDLPLVLDNDPTVPNKDARARAAEYAVRFVKRVLLNDTSIPQSLGAEGDPAVTLQDKAPVLLDPGGHGLPRVASEPFGEPGLDGDLDNTDVVATAEYQGAVYLLVRNDVAGAAVWRLAGGVLSPVPFPDGVKNGVYGNKLINGLLGSMAVYQDKLWVGFSSGVQGSVRGSTGAEVWTYDGAAWAPVVANRADADPEFAVARIGGCALDDGDTVAQIVVTGPTLMTPGAWALGVADDIDSIDPAAAAPHLFEIVDNTATTLTVRLNDKSSQDEFAVCDGLAVGAKLKLRRGLDESGFGQPWNKAITGMAVLGDKLYIGTGLNLDVGAEVYVTGDGATFTVAVPRSFFGTHPNGHPISSSIATLHTSGVSGAELLYFGATGTENYGARVGVLADGVAPRFIIDDSVDADDAGLDEAGMGHANYQVPSMLDYGGRLWLSAFNYQGFELISLTDPFDRSTFKVEVGTGAAIGPGFGRTSQIAGYLSSAGGALWAGTIDLIQTDEELAARSGAAFRTKDLSHWQLASGHAFGVNGLSVSRIFELDGVIYAVSSRGSLNSKASFGALQMYTLRDEKYPN